MRLGLALLAAALVGCAAAPAPADSVVPGTIGVVVERAASGVAVSALGREGQTAGLRVGDVVLRYNGQAVTDPRQLYDLIIDSRPGSVARLEVRREGAVHVVELPVRQLDLTPRI